MSRSVKRNQFRWAVHRSHWCYLADGALTTAALNSGVPVWSHRERADELA